jgi:cytochrome c-type biogenesis protein CcmH
MRVREAPSREVRGTFLPLCGKKVPRVLVALTVSVLAAALAAPALGGTPRTSLPDIEDEVMCPICGTLLQLAESPQAQRERAFVRRQIAAGKDKAEIKDALLAQYGRDVLALPSGTGFDLSAYLVPAIAFVIAAVALGFGIARWRRSGGDSGSPPPTTDGPGREDAERLEADLARYDL